MKTAEKRVKIKVNSGCNLLEAIQTATRGLNENNLRGILRDLRLRGGSSVEVTHIKDKKYYVKYEKNAGIIEVPEEVTKIGLLIAGEYLRNRSNICNCCLFKGNKCLRTLFL